MKPLFSLLALASTLTLTQAQSYIATLDGAQDGGAGRMGSGSVMITLSGTTLTFSGGTYSGLSANATAAHIHGPGLPLNQGGLPAGVLYTLGGGAGSVIPLGSTAGTISGTVNLVANPNGTTFTVAQQLAQLNGGQWYVNIHTSTFPGGEIRGQILLVPEPATWTLGGLGLLGLLAWRRRK
jgi:MYXO-CTERM domain-containing protein